MGILLCVWFGCGFIAAIFCIRGDVSDGQITLYDIGIYILLVVFGCISLLIAGCSYIADQDDLVIWKKKNRKD